MRTSDLLQRAVGLGLLVALLVNGTATAEIVMQVDGVDGETCFTPDHDKWICVLAVSHGATSPCALVSSGGSGTTCGRASFSDVTATIAQDSASPQLLTRMLKGEQIKSVTVEWWADGSKGKILTSRLLLENVVITSLQASSGGERPTENVSFLFSKVTSTVWPKTPDGGGVPKATCWDLVKNAPC
jgi:type VI secretion system secreted protein Hcp